jgi:hypothetical protein
LGTVFVAGRKRVPSPATGITAFVIFIASKCHRCEWADKASARERAPRQGRRMRCSGYLGIGASKLATASGH